MKVVIVLAAMVAVAVARPQEPQLTPGIVPILDFQDTRDEHNQYALSYLSGDGTKVAEQGALVPNADGTDNVLVKQGSFSYFAPDGTEITETWTADADGFRAQGPHLPVAPSAAATPSV